MKKRILFIFAAAFLLSLIFASSSLALNACCERTTNGEWCQYTDESECDSDYLSTYASCEQTSYCSVGTCYSSDSGSCYGNTPKATCEAEDDTTWTSDSLEDVPQCQKGCCTIGDQGFFVTEVQCKNVGSDYEEASVSFDDSVQTESACLDSAKNLDFGCCVDGDSYTFTTRESCASAGEEETVGTNFTERGFHEDMLCSNDLLSSGCAKQQTTGCYQGKVYWYDSCGNRENIYSTDERASYNDGYALSEQESCTLNGAYDPSCGNCDYAEGTLCGADVDGVMDVGEVTCIDLSCENTFENDASPLSGYDRNNGESWCVYDSRTGEALDTVGSRQYRHLCISGEEITESCADFREEVCLSGVLTEDVLGTLDALHLSNNNGYVESACRDNRYETCQACNSEEGLTARYECCTDEDTRDCYWMEAPQSCEDDSDCDSGESCSSGQCVSEDESYPEGICVSQVPPGLQFWSDDGSGDGTATSTTCDVASTTCTVEYRIGGVSRALHQGSDPKNWKIVSESPDGCLSRDWLVDQNTLCRAQGDCGAYFNYVGEPGYDGLASTLFDEDFFNDDTNNPIGDWEPLSEEDLGDTDYLASNDAVDESPWYWSALAWRNVATYVGLASMISGGVGNALKGSQCNPAETATEAAAAVGTAAGATDATAAAEAKVAADKVAAEAKAKTDAEAKAKAAAACDPARIAGETNCAIAPTDQTCKNYVAKQYLDCIETELVRAPAFPLRAGELNKATTGVSTAAAAIGGINSAAEGTGKLNKIFGKGTATGCFLGGFFPFKGIFQPKTVGGFVQFTSAITLISGLYLVVDYAFQNETTITYNVDCNLWQPPEGGDNCELCNNADVPCSEYKCRSLGASCDLVNEGTGNETCVSLFVNDVNSPVIEPAEGLISEDLEIREGTEEGNKGYEVTTLIPAFTDVQLGIQTDEPAICKYSAEPSTNYEDMTNNFGSELYVYNHSILFSLGDEVTDEEILALNQGIYSIYVRCSDVQGNANERDYYISFTVDTTPDLTPPEVRYTSIDNGAYMSYQLEETPFSIWTNEPADCRWNTNDTGYDFMSGTMDCASSGFEQSSLYYGTYECSTTLTGVTASDENTYYFRCKDQTGNVNEDSFVFTTRASESELDIVSVSPDDVSFDTDVTLELETDGGADDGKAVCAFSTEDVGYNSMIQFANTNDTVHTQALTLVPGDYTYYFMCQDVAGNQAGNSTSFTVEVDTAAPEIESVYVDPAYSTLTLIMDEASTCEYASDTFSFGEGTEMTGENTTAHDASLDFYRYYIACEDAYSNQGTYFVDISTWV